MLKRESEKKYSGRLDPIVGTTDLQNQIGLENGTVTSSYLQNCTRPKSKTADGSQCDLKTTADVNQRDLLQVIFSCDRLDRIRTKNNCTRCEKTSVRRKIVDSVSVESASDLSEATETSHLLPVNLIWRAFDTITVIGTDTFDWGSSFLQPGYNHDASRRTS